MTVKDALKFANEKGAKMVDLKFCDLIGTWQHLTIPLHQLTEESFEQGFGFDGSSIRGWKGIEESDMIIKPDPASAGGSDARENCADGHPPPAGPGAF